MATKQELLKAKQLLQSHAPKGEFLAYINKDEAQVLKNLGGSGRIVEATQIPSYDVTETRQLYDPQLAGSRTALLKSVDSLGAGLAGQLANYQGLDVSQFAPQIAGRNALQTGPEGQVAGLMTDAQNRATAAQGLGSLTGTGAGTGAGSIASYMSPYQQQVIDASLSEFDRNAAIQQTSARDQAYTSGAYGGAREGVMQAEALRNSNMNRANLQSGLLQQGFENAQTARGADLVAQQGLGQYQQGLNQFQQDLGSYSQGLGVGQQGYNQAVLDAQQVANREQQYSPYTQIGLIGQQLSQMTPGTYPITSTTSTPQSTAPVSPLQQYIGGAGAVGGILGKLLG